MTTLPTLRLTSFAAIGLTACLAACSPSQQPGADRPAPATPAPAPRSGPTETDDHDDPVVVDNPEMTIYRKNGRHGAPSKSGNKWQLGEAKPFTRIEVTSWKSKEEGYILALDQGAESYEFFVVENNMLKKAFTLTRQGSDKATVYVTEDWTEFDPEGEKSKKIKSKKLSHIGQIKIGTGEWICVANGPTPARKACDASRLTTPHALTVQICANTECSVTTHHDQR